MSGGHAKMRRVLSITRILPDVIGAQDAAVAKDDLEYPGASRHRKVLENVFADTGDRIQLEVPLLLIDHVVEKSAKFRAAKLRRNVGDLLKHGSKIQVCRKQASGRKQELLDTGMGPQLFLGAKPFGDIPGDLGGADDLAVACPDGRDRQRDGDHLSVLCYTDRIEMIDIQTVPDAIDDHVLFAELVRRDQYRDMFSDDLAFLVAKQPLGRAVPASDISLQRLADDGILG